MKLTTKKLAQIIREEVANVVKDAMTEAPNYGDYDPETGKRLPTDAQRRFRSRERNVGVGDYVPPTQLIDTEKTAIADTIEEFLAKVNDENSGWWPQTWLGGGRVYDPSDKRSDKDGYYDRPDEQNAAMRARFDHLRGQAERNPFTVDHIKQDIKQTGSSAWYRDEKTGQRWPSLSAFIKGKLIKMINKKLRLTEADAEDKLKAYLNGL